VERRVDPTDARARLIFLTPEGETRVAEIRRVLTKGEEAMLVDIADADIAAMLQHFDRIERRLEALLKEPRP
jgi:MarR family transcriptional regulator for hemolysin